MKISSILGNSQKLDGGAMFGNAPKAMWSRWVEVDDRNRIDLACRALLVETGERNLLFETGIGAYMEPKFKDRFGVQESEHILLKSLAELGLTHKDIDTVFLSHLHFDHAGGLLSEYRDGSEPKLLFPKAEFYAGKLAWDRAKNPHPRDRASFVPSLNRQLEESGRLKLVDENDELEMDGLKIRFHLSEGHTPGMLCSDLNWNGGRIIFAADLIPGAPWVHLPITMGYDRYPERLIDEKRTLLQEVVDEKAWLFFTHDSRIACSRVEIEPNRHKFQPVDGREKLVRVAEL